MRFIVRCNVSARIRLVFVLLAFCMLGSQAVRAQSCGDDITRAAGLCVQKRGLDAALDCRQAAVRDCACNTATNRCSGAGGSCSAQLEAEAKINVDWILADRGARGTFESHKQLGESPFDAAVSAQAHNPPVQKLLRQCRGWVEAYLGRGGPCTLSDTPPDAATCRCITVLPTGQFDQTGAPSYKVSSSCTGAYNISVQFIDASASGAPPSTGQPQLVCPSKSFVVRAPQTFLIPSISGVRLQSANGGHTCVCRDKLCS
ncbi:hypothetical protein [Bradyrhizobium centrosematis]|jgi:hypothetical protein|uniref:hypothetical protein n=1 Tax=Bradyrhizobium centrosematis TaxID=1300039 RepID=UPI00216A3E4F|nr:hypothetical protein [Bradyrhizobium centrosematis]MCS3761564.1 hypothetical protein [Bradyrhizobium centrosematis]MCS3774232.1 hypothetical protein [Bradyrhizobium centrosematis]